MSRFKSTIKSLEMQVQKHQKVLEGLQAENTSLQQKEGGLLSSLVTLHCGMSALASGQQSSPEASGAVCGANNGGHVSTSSTGAAGHGQQSPPTNSSGGQPIPAQSDQDMSCTSGVLGSQTPIPLTRPAAVPSVCAQQSPGAAAAAALRRPLTVNSGAESFMDPSASDLESQQTQQQLQEHTRVQQQLSVLEQLLQGALDQVCLILIGCRVGRVCLELGPRYPWVQQ
jgi:hypothetical protein